MLEDLENIPWAEMKHALGPADDVPGLIRDLNSADQKVRGRAIFALFDRLCHQGTVYEASSHAVPFLVDLLRAADTPDKLGIADLLAAMADGHSYLEASLASEPMQKLMRQALAREGRDFDQELDESRRYALETKAAVKKHLPLLYPYLTCEEPEVRRSVARAMKNYPERAGEALPLLRGAAASESDEDVRQALEEAIAMLEPGHP